MRLQHKEAQHIGGRGLEDVAQQQEVAQRLAHLLVVDLQHAAVHPVIGEGAAACGLGLGALVLVMREHQVGAAAVDIERQAQVLARHSRALDVPAGTALAPRAFPRRLAGFGGLPQREVQMVALAIFQALAVGAQLAMTAFHLVDVATGQRTVISVAAHAEINVALDLVRMAAIDEFLDEPDHLGDLLGCARAHIGVLHVHGVHIVKEGLRIFSGNLGCAAALFVGLLDDLVINVGDIGDELHVEAAPGEVAADDVEADERTGVADVDVVVHGGTAHVHADLPVLKRLERHLLAKFGVVDLKHLHSCSMCMPHGAAD